MLQDMSTVGWYPKPLPMAQNRVLVRVLVVILRPSETHNSSLEGANLCGFIGQLYPALEGLCQTVRLLGKDEARRDGRDLVGVLDALHVQPGQRSTPTSLSSFIAEWAMWKVRAALHMDCSVTSFSN